MANQSPMLRLRGFCSLIFCMGVALLFVAVSCTPSHQVTRCYQAQCPSTQHADHQAWYGSKHFDYDAADADAYNHNHYVHSPGGAATVHEVGCLDVKKPPATQPTR